MQELLNAVVLAPRAVKVHAWDKVISAPLAWRLETPPNPEDLRAGAARLRAAFAPGAVPAAAPLALLAGGEASPLAAAARRARNVCSVRVRVSRLPSSVSTAP